MPARRRHRHRVGKSLSTRHSCPADAERKCRPLPTRPAGRHCRRQMPTVRARDRGVGIFDPRVGMSRRCASRNPSVTRSAVGRPASGDSRVGNDGGCMHDSVLHMGGRETRGISFGAYPDRSDGRGPVEARIAGRSHRALVSPAVTPDSIRGPACQAPLSPGFPRIGGPGRAWTPDRVRGDKRGAETVPFVGTEPVPEVKPDSSGTSPAMTTWEQTG